VRGLVAERALVEEVAEEAQGEDGGGQEVAGRSPVAAEEAGEEVRAVFAAGDDAVGNVCGLAHCDFIASWGSIAGGVRLTSRTAG